MSTLEPPELPALPPPEPDSPPPLHDPMAPRPFQRRKRNSSKVNATISLVFHILLIGVAFIFAAREGFFGKNIKALAIVIVPKEKKPEPPKEKPQEAKKEQRKAPPKQAATAPKAPAAVKNAAAPPPVVSAPPPVATPTFVFNDGAKDTTSDPVLAYKGFVEHTLRTRWNKPEGMADDAFVAEVNLTLDAAGKVMGYDWLKGSNDKRWDDSVRQVLAGTKAIGRPPPAGFPEKFVVRFDVEAAKTESLIPGR